jgi:RNA polymerase sigma-70 factor (ECF subfamily)
MHDTAAADAAFRSELTALIPYMRAFARTLCRDPSEAEDLAQEALAKAWAARASYAPGTNLKAWTFLILRNHFYSQKRRSWRSSALDPEVAEQTLVAITNPDGGLELDELRRALAMLPDEQREALILVGAGGLSYDEVAEISGVPVGTVKSRVSRARDRLALIFAEGRLAEDGQSPGQAMSDILRQFDRYRMARAA